MPPTFSPQAEKEIETLLATHLTRESCSIPVLWIAQREFGWISAEVKDLVAARLKISRQLVEGVASFYTMFRREAPGKHAFEVCMTLPCVLQHAEELLAFMEDKLGVKAGGTSANGQYSLGKMECLGACGFGPVVVHNGTYHENMTPAKLEALLKKLG